MQLERVLAEKRNVQSDNYGGRWATIMMAGEGVAE